MSGGKLTSFEAWHMGGPYDAMVRVYPCYDNLLPDVLEATVLTNECPEGKIMPVYERDGTHFDGKMVWPLYRWVGPEMPETAEPAVDDAELDELLKEEP